MTTPELIEYLDLQRAKANSYDGVVMLAAAYDELRRLALLGHAAENAPTVARVTPSMRLIWAASGADVPPPETELIIRPKVTP